ncbi:peptidoglycan D,D-transpeptidase FtsI family protein [Verticiella sediminum]|nr:penicillin-binding protein 2 [Verticiella sediminum]
MRRARFVQFMLLAGFAVLAARALYLQGLSNEFLQRQGEARYERTLTLPASRGKVLDRNGVVLAASIPARAIWAIPEDVSATPEQLRQLGSLLDIPERELRARLIDSDRSFVYLKRQLPVDVAEQVRALGIAGVHQERETMRIYPQGEVMAHVVGFTNIDGHGQEGVELAFDESLAGTPGSRRVIKDRLGRVVEDVQMIRPPVDGADLRLSIDSRLQYLAFNHLRETIDTYKAKAGSAVVLDARTGEVLALANLPTYDPARRVGLTGDSLRNRVFTDQFEPGSTMKPFSVALALDQKRIAPTTTFKTYGGRMTFAGHTITDVSRSTELDITGILQKSSNVGMTQISERLAARDMWNTFSALGFGQAPALGFPGVAAGRLRPWERWRPIEKATMSYGYGLSLSLAQLARAYTAFARDGDVASISLIKRDSAPTTTPVYTPQTARNVRGMLEVAAGFARAQVPGYRVAGKSGTARKIIDGAYSRTRYTASFVGFAPVSNPRIVVAVRIDEPGGDVYYGGRVAAPAFSSIMGGSLRLLGVEPDAQFQTLRVAESQAAQAGAAQ